jgi:hypothetical protein
MSNNFDWQTEDDRPGSEADWELPETKASPPPRFRPRWRLIGLLAALVFAAGALVWWRVDQRMEATLQAMRRDVASSYNLIQKAAADRDEELFRSVLSGRDPAWTSAQLGLFEEGLVLDRGSIGLTPAEGSIPSVLPTEATEISANESAASIDFSPDLNEAVVVNSQPYVTAEGAPVFLRQTSVYRRGDQRWLLAPPLQTFWGDMESAETGRLAVRYPARDRVIVNRLAEDLSDHVDRMCATLSDIDCDNDLIAVDFETDPATLADFSRPLGPVPVKDRQSEPLRLPTPTLVGLPLDGEGPQAAAGYEALLDAYAAQLVGAIIAESVGWACCDQAYLASILVDRQLSELGLKAWPVGAAERRRVQDERIPLATLGPIWWEQDTQGFPPERNWLAYVAVDFLLAALPDTSTAALQRALTQSSNLEDWFGQVFSQSNAETRSWIASSLEQAWWLYNFEGSIEDLGAAPLPDDSDLLMACATVEATNRPEPSRLLRYAEVAGWEDLYTLDGFIWMSPLRNRDALLMQEFSFASETWQTNLWRNDRHEFAYDEGEVYSVSFGESDPAGETLVAYSYDPGFGQTSARALDLTTCDNGCDQTELPGIPTWSPNGERAIYAGDDGLLPSNTLVTNGRAIILDTSDRFQPQLLQLGPGQAATLADLVDAGFGYSPFWLDDDTYGYIRSVNSGFLGPHRDQVLMLASVDGGEPQALLETAELEQVLPQADAPRHLMLGYVMPHPTDRELLFIVALDTFGRQAYVFSYDLQAGQPSLRLQLGYEANHSLGFSPDGRYLVLTGNQPDPVPGNNTGLLLLHDIAANTTTPFATRLPFFVPSVAYDWTQDSETLAMALDDGLLGIVVPAARKAYPVTHPYGTCTSVAWMAR